MNDHRRITTALILDITGWGNRSNKEKITLKLRITKANPYQLVLTKDEGVEGSFYAEWPWLIKLVSILNWVIVKNFSTHNCLWVWHCKPWFYSLWKHEYFFSISKKREQQCDHWLEHFYLVVSSPLNHFMQRDHDEYNLRMSWMFSLLATDCRIPSSLFFSAKSKKGPPGNFPLS